MNTIITGLGLVLLGACVGVGTRSAGIAWGRTHRCVTAWVIRGVAGFLLYGLSGHLTVMGFVKTTAAQSFSRDAQFSARTPRSAADENAQQQQIEDLSIHMHSQEVINAQQAAAMGGLEQRLQRVESIKPDTVALRLDGLESTMKLGIGLLVTIFGAMVLNLWSSWTKRPKGSEGS